MYGQKEYYFSLNIDQDEMMRLYRGSVKRLRVRAHTGQVLDLDANHLRQFTSLSGVHGNFRLVTSSQNKFIKIERI